MAENTDKAAQKAAEEAAKAKAIAKAAREKARAEKKAAREAKRAERAAKAAQKPVDTRPIPVWRDASGAMVVTKLKGKDFPKTREGKVAYCRFQADKWTAKAERVATSADPEAKISKKIDKLTKMVALLQKEKADLAAKKSGQATA